jgi:hypothetical protein
VGAPPAERRGTRAKSYAPAGKRRCGSPSDQEPFDLDGVAEGREADEELVMGSATLKAHCDVAGREPLAQELEAPQQIMKSHMDAIDVLRTLDCDPEAG